MENIDARLAALGFVKKGKEWHRIEPGNWVKLVVFFSPSWDSWVLERHKRTMISKRYRMEGKDWDEYVLAEDLLRALE